MNIIVKFSPEEVEQLCIVEANELVAHDVPMEATARYAGPYDKTMIVELSPVTNKVDELVPVK